MKAKMNKNGTISINQISEAEFMAMSYVLNVANDRCFDEQNEDGDYYSNDDFVVCLTSEQREGLKEICKII